MIFEELQAEIDQQTNKLVIDKVASLLADPYKWDQLFVVMDRIDLSRVIDPTSITAVRLRYVAALRKYVSDKIQLAKASRIAHHFDWPESQFYYGQYIKAEKDLQLSKWNKNASRAEMIFHGLDYKEYHNNITTRLY